jgi:tetratricopeptide (TPR) repeat protein
MQESGPAPLVERVPSEAFDTISEPTKRTSPKSRRPRRTKRPTDPVVGWLTLGIGLVIILWLVGVLSALLFGVWSPGQAPRTSAERDLRALTLVAKSGKANSRTYAQYVGVLIGAGQLRRAEQALDGALKAAKADKSYLYSQQAQLFLARKDYAGAATAADKAMAEAKAELQAYKDENLKNNRKANAGASMPASYAEAALAKAQALVASEDWAGAIKAFDLYIAEQPIDSDIIVRRALAKIEAGDKAGAEADFRAALKYIPDYQPALDGLKRIGAAQ